MAVLIEAISVVLRREAIARRYPGGWAGYQTDAPNSTLCADTEIARVGFMHPDNVGVFMRVLERHGFVFLNSAEEAVDIVVIDQREGPTRPCAWIEVFRQDIPGGSVAAARLKPSADKSLITPDGWVYEHSLSKNFNFYPGADTTEHLDLVRSELTHKVFRDRVTGEERYMDSPAPRLSPRQTPSDALVDEYNALWSKVASQLARYAGPDRAHTQEDFHEVVDASQSLERLTTIAPGNWRAWWLQGVARRALDDRQGAYAAFSRAYGLAPQEVEAGRNLVAECMSLGYAEEAKTVAAAVCAVAPDDAGLKANYAMALLVAGDVDEALDAARRSLAADPEDAVTANVLTLIEQVRSGQTERPSRIIY